MIVVVDVGCVQQRQDESIGPLIERFRPDVLYGFDPSPALTPGEYVEGGCRVRLDRRAAWTHEGTIEYADAGIDATVMREKNALGEWDAPTSEVPCFDLAAFLVFHPGAVVKLDCEGAEFPLLAHLHLTEVDQLVSLLLVEWHDDVMGGPFPERRRRLERALRCPTEEWH